MLCITKSRTQLSNWTELNWRLYMQVKRVNPGFSLQEKNFFLLFDFVSKWDWYSTYCNDNFMMYVRLVTLNTLESIISQYKTRKKTTTFKSNGSWTSLVVQWLRLHTSSAGGMGSIPGRGAKSYMPQLKNLYAATKVWKKELVAPLCLTLRIPWTATHQAPLFMEFSRQEYWTGLPFPTPGNLPNPRFEPKSPTLQADSFFFFFLVWILLFILMILRFSHVFACISQKLISISCWVVFHHMDISPFVYSLIFG